QRPPVEKLHEQVRLPVGGLAEIDDLDDPGVADRRRRARLVPETLDDLRLRRELRVEELHRRAPLDDRVLGEVHRAHAALSEGCEDAVVADELSDERRAFGHDGGEHHPRSNAWLTSKIHHLKCSPRNSAVGLTSRSKSTTYGRTGTA